MFNNLTNFGYDRTGKEAFGFYIAYFFLAVLVGGILGGIIGVIMGGEDGDALFQAGVRVGTVFAVVISVGLSIAVVQAKNISEDFQNIVLIVLSGVLALVIGGLGGLIPAAYLTTRKKKGSVLAPGSETVHTPPSTPVVQAPQPTATETGERTQ